MKRTAVLTVLLTIISLTSFHPKAAAGIIDSLYVSYLNEPSVQVANKVFAELYREEQTDTLIRFDSSAKPSEVGFQVNNSMANYYLSRQDLNSALDANKRATAIVDQNNKELAQQCQEMKRSNDRWLWLCITLAALLLSAAVLLFIVWRRSKSMMREQNETKHIKSSFISYISQELREPMLTVKEAGLTLRAGHIDSSGDNHRIGDLIVKRCNSMLNLLTRMNIKSTDTTPSMRSGDFVYFVRSIVEAHSEEASARQIKLEFKTPLKTLFVNYVPENIQHIIDLLINNSLIHTESQGSIVVELPQPDNDRLKFTVRDNGTGIPVEKQPYIFSPGSEGLNATDNDKADTEAIISLVLARMLTIEMDGTISFVSEPGKETIFTIDLPYVPDNASATEHDKAIPNINEWLRQDSSDKTNAAMAFIVESDEDEAFLVARNLNDQFKIRYAREGWEALQSAQGLVPDLIITDAVLPDMNGTEFVRQLRGNETLSHIPIIAMANNTSEKERLKLFQAGVDVLLVKPISPEEMRFASRHIVKQRASLLERYRKINADKAPEPAEVQLSKSDTDFINKMVDVIHAQMALGSIDMEQISDAMSLSRKQLRSRVMDLTGLTPIAYVLQVRLEYAKQLMADNGLSLTQIANKCCFQNLSHFSKAFKQQYGVPPQQYRKGIDGTRKL